jgi:hypothetical protein
VQALEGELQAAHARAAALQRQLEAAEGARSRGGGAGGARAGPLPCGVLARGAAWDCLPSVALYRACGCHAHANPSAPLQPPAEVERLGQASGQLGSRLDAQGRAAAAARDEAEAARREGHELRQQAEATAAQVPGD